MDGGYCRHPRSPQPCLCAPPGLDRAGYAALLEARRAAHVKAWREGASIADDPGKALRMAVFFESCELSEFWADGDPSFTPPRVPRESPEARTARIRASRERRLREAQDRVDGYERTHPINEHGVSTGPSVADNNWRNRQSAENRELDSWKQYEKDIKTIRHLTGLLNKETK